MDYLDPQTDDPDGGALSLLSTRHRKKQAEHDSQLLANRIALLKKEEERALKKIEKTKQRALELISMRHESEKRLQERVLNSEKAARAQKKHQEEILEHEKLAVMNRQSKVAKEVQKKIEGVQKVRQEKQVSFLPLLRPCVVVFLGFYVSTNSRLPSIPSLRLR
jgi:hypothetical protein